MSILLVPMKLFCDSLVEIVVVNKERKLDYSEQFDEGRDLMTVKGITYPSFVWKRCFFSKEDIEKTEAVFLRSDVSSN